MYRSLNTHSRMGTDQSTLEKYLGVSHLSGISVSVLIRDRAIFISAMGPVQLKIQAKKSLRPMANNEGKKC